MKIAGIGQVKKSEILSILSREGKQSVKDGDMTIDEAADLYKVEQVKKAAECGKFGDTFSTSYMRIPKDLRQTLTPAQLGSLVDALRQAYSDGQDDGKN